ncbi:Survival motor neuron 1 [Fusarium coicis]|nr:Survival motor neuron 1 [Fusarium coicis]
MSKKQEKLTQEEIWDDSVLIDSWNEALQEYKKYHSIHAKGGSEIPSSRNESKEPIASQGTPSFPIQTVLGSVQDESLKKLLMSWYYAGYYTGLYEGQQQAQQK